MLFEDPSETVIADLDVQLHRGWLSASEADLLQEQLADSVAWTQHYVQLFGRRVASPRLSCWIGDEGVAYRYSGTRHLPQTWPAAIQALRFRLDASCATRFNSCLANRYRDGDDSMGWHADDEPELGAQPIIASLSLGARRSFRLRRRSNHREHFRFELAHGDLLIMHGSCQTHWQHALPKVRGVTSERINLTFRRVLGAREKS